MAAKKYKKLRKLKKFLNYIRHLNHLRYLRCFFKNASIPLAVMIPASANADTIVSVFPHYLQPLSLTENHDIKNGIGVGSRITFRPMDYINLFAQGDYLSLSLPNVEPITVLDGSVGVGYHIPITERMSFNADMQVGTWWGKYKDSMTSMYGSFSLSFEIKLNPIVSTQATASISHYNAGNSSLLTGAQFSPGISVNLTEFFNKDAKVKMKTKEQFPVFPVLYSWYEKNPFAKINLTNEEDCSISNVVVKFYQPQYMNQPNECAKIPLIKKGENVDVDLTAFFNERMLDLLEMTDTNATVSIEYDCMGLKKSRDYVMTIPVCDRNSMSWDDDRRAAVFVSSKDPAAMYFSKLISSVVRDNIRNGVPENVQYAMGIFDVLDEFGINYVIDPSSAYSENVGTSSVDFLQFPYQTLMYRGGDCDDLSILTCSLFEAVGINTAFITIPGHIFMAFDSGVSYEEAKYVFSEKDYFINHEGQAWIPLEITLTDEGFSKAWRTGAREWKIADSQGKAALYTMKDSWKLYKPVSVPGAAVKFSMVDEQIVGRIYDHSIENFISREISEQVNEYLAKIQRDGKIEDINALGVLYGRYGLYDKAEKQLKIGRRLKYLPSILNTANVYYSMKEYEIAREWYKQFLRLEPDNSLALLGIAKCSYELEDFEECDKAYSKVFKITPALAYSNTYLGAFENKSGRAFSLSQRLANTIWIKKEKELLLYESEDKNNENKDSPDFTFKQVEIAYVKNNEESEINSDSDFDSEPNKLDSDKEKLLKKQLEEENLAEEKIASITNPDNQESDEDFIASLENLPDGVLTPDALFEEEVAVKDVDSELAEIENSLIEENDKNKEIALIDNDVDNEEYDDELEEEDFNLIGLINQIKIASTVLNEIDETSEENGTIDDGEIININDVNYAIAINDEINNDSNINNEEIIVKETSQIAKSEDEQKEKPFTLSASKADEFERRNKIVVAKKDSFNREVVEKKIEKGNQSNNIENIVFRDVPRYSQTESSAWVSEDVYKATIIEGMKSFDEEMGIADDKDYLTKDINDIVCSPFDDVEKIEKVEHSTKNEKASTKAQADALSFLASLETTENEKVEIAEKSVPKIAVAKIENTTQNSKVEKIEKTKKTEKVEISTKIEKVENEEIKSLQKSQNNETFQAKKTNNYDKSDKNLHINNLKNENDISENDRIESVKKVEKSTEENEVKKECSDYWWLIWLFVSCGILGLFWLFIILWKRKDEEDDQQGKKK